MHESQKSTFKTDVVRLMSGTGLAQIISFFAMPLLTRLFPPEAFGTVALFGSLTGIIGILACMRYELSIVLPKNDREAANLFAVSIGFSILIGFITFIMSWLYGLQFLVGINISNLVPYIYLIPVTVLIHGFYMAFNYWNTRYKNFTHLSIARITKSTVSNSSNIGAGFVGYATGGVMIIAKLFGQFTATLVLGWKIWKNNSGLFLESISWAKMKEGLIKYKNFPIFSSWSGILNTLSWQLPVLMLGTFFSSTIVGYYSLGFQVLQVPMSLIGSSISQVFHQRAAEAYHQNVLNELVENLIQRLISISLFPILLLCVIGSDLYIIVFGEKWAEAGLYTQILSAWALVWFISSPLSNIYGVLDKQSKGLVINFNIFSTRIISILIGAYYNNVILALVLFSISGVFVYGYLIYDILRLSGVKTLNLANNNIIKLGILTIILLFVITLLKLYISSLYIVVTSLLLIILYFLCVGMVYNKSLIIFRW